ncbi:hypothetical protein M427DRAFT_235796 [Gonapodya prolifera JEL478]|uniref:t-SNARE coiled-coil homology domain-containing protein n=1 Tax=Gonapodya prolifera (strain JEL478) TaxID=1344416 RepID=A0A139AME6_GONPJ|nr:hypothetical protein M427DRAFT_235796 [Gonapodya prolifera JEL478]|eukprot:KXS17947.1 hypothetical protein M427DRAFT_235796 [Gonapodya prolifera JEL478]
MSSAWKPDVDALSKRIDGLTATVIERQKAHRANLGPSPETDPKLRSDLANVRAAMESLEARLSAAEDSGAVGEQELSRFEDAVVGLLKRVGRVETVLGGDGATGVRLGGDVNLGKDGASRAPGRASPRNGASASTFASRNQRSDPLSAPKGADAYAHLDDRELYGVQHQIMSQQDESLDLLSDTIERQRQIGLQITDELDLHVQLLEDTEVAVDRTSSRLAGARKRLEWVLKEGRTNWGFTIVMYTLLIL